MVAALLESDVVPTLRVPTAPSVAPAAAPPVVLPVGGVPHRDLFGQAALLAAALYGAALLAFALTLGSDGEAFFVVAIATLNLVMYFGVASLMGAMGRPSGRIEADRGEFVGTFTGPMHRNAALAQILTVPALLAFGVAAMCVIFLVMAAR